MKFKVGDRVKWVDSDGNTGSGGVFSANETDICPHYVVIMDAEPGDPHLMVYCAETSLLLQ